MVLQIFSEPSDRAPFRRAVRAIVMQVRNDKVVLKLHSGGEETLVRERRIQEVLTDQASCSEGSPYFLSITEGAEVMT